MPSGRVWGAIWWDVYCEPAYRSARRLNCGHKRGVNRMTTKRSYGTPAMDVHGNPVLLLSGGNPQIEKGDGDAPVQAYIAAMPEWKYDLGRRLDEIVEQNVPDVQKAVRWNSPWYGVEGLGWFLSTHCFAKYVKVTFMNGSSLDPLPPETGKDPDARWVNIREGELDEEQMAEWVRQSAALPGWDGF